MPLSFIKQVILISQFEIKRGFTTPKGLLSLATFCVVWAVILWYPLRYAATLLLQEKSLKHDVSFFDFMGFGSLQQWPIPEFGVYWHIALFIFPILSITIAADQTSSDRQRGTLRFLSLRSTRNSLFFGRFVGAMSIQMLLILATALSTLMLVVFRDSTVFFTALTNLLVIFVNLTLVILPFTAMMAVLSAKVKSARQVTVWAILVWTLLASIISGLAHYLPFVAVFINLIPGNQLAVLTQLTEWQTLQLAYIPLLQSTILLALGQWLLARQPL